MYFLMTNLLITANNSHIMVFDKSLIEITKEPMTRDQAIDRLLTKLCHRHYITNIEEVRTAILNERLSQQLLSE